MCTLTLGKPRSFSILSVDLNRRLRQIAPLPEPELSPQRTVGYLLQTAQNQRERGRRRRITEVEAKWIQELNALAEMQARRGPKCLA